MPTESKTYRATATVEFRKIRDYIEPIVDSIATHDMTVTQRKGVHHIASAFGRATIETTDDGLVLMVEASELGALNRLKHAIMGPIGFIATSEKPDIRWKGDYSPPTLPDDLRVLRVVDVEDINQRLRRVTFQGNDLARYDRNDQLHCRLIFQKRGVDHPKWPMLDHTGNIVWPNDISVPTRVYTIRHIELVRQELTIDFAIHANAGPATTWAINAQRGDIVGILGPAANGPKDADFYVLAGDETGLPGIARILENLPEAAAGFAIIEVNDEHDELKLRTPSQITVTWLHRRGAAPGTTTLLETAVKSIQWQEKLDRCFFWGGCEHKAFSAIYRHLRREIGLPRDRLAFYSHWHRSLSEDEIIARGAQAYLPN